MPWAFLLFPFIECPGHSLRSEYACEFQSSASSKSTQSAPADSAGKYAALKIARASLTSGKQSDPAFSVLAETDGTDLLVLAHSRAHVDSDDGRKAEKAQEQNHMRS